MNDLDDLYAWATTAGIVCHHRKYTGVLKLLLRDHLTRNDCVVAVALFDGGTWLVVCNWSGQKVNERVIGRNGALRWLWNDQNRLLAEASGGQLVGGSCDS